MLNTKPTERRKGLKNLGFIAIKRLTSGRLKLILSLLLSKPPTQLLKLQTADKRNHEQQQTITSSEFKSVNHEKNFSTEQS